MWFFDSAEPVGTIIPDSTGQINYNTLQPLKILVK
jgi:hypothetical protein